ncbi:MAG: hypothetical protein A3J99_06600 [Sideroxydans sp. RIFOXYD2_FULL_59_7]|nr:MAG: hypothetical protein A3J99_06600 [Sideroxydans sp. RIFOXYD2_FULL_59_7]
MAGAGKQSWCLIPMFGMVLAFAAAEAGAVPLVEKAARQNNSEKVAKSKTVHFIEKRPEADSKTHVETKDAELPLPVPQKLPVSEPQPLELKGVRG